MNKIHSEISRDSSGCKRNCVQQQHTFDGILNESRAKRQCNVQEDWQAARRFNDWSSIQRHTQSANCCDLPA